MSVEDASGREGPQSAETGRFAPSTTGPAHPGTLLAGLLCWLDARSRGARLVLRLEDLDPERCRPEWSRAMREDLAWLGLDWDAESQQSAVHEQHEAALDRLEAAGALYPCRCSRSELRAQGRLAPDGGYAYAGGCRKRELPAGGWRASGEPLRARLPAGAIDIEDEGGEPLVRDPLRAFGDPIVRRRDGAVAYHLASVADDARAGVTRVVRGRDLAASTATQVALQRLLGVAQPAYRHHLLLLEERDGGKLAKLHGAVGMPDLRAAGYDAAQLCGLLAQACSLRDAADPVAPAELLAEFDWRRVSAEDRATAWTGGRLRLLP